MILRNQARAGRRQARAWFKNTNMYIRTSKQLQLYLRKLSMIDLATQYYYLDGLKFLAILQRNLLGHRVLIYVHKMQQVDILPSQNQALCVS